MSEYELPQLPDLTREELDTVSPRRDPVAQADPLRLVDGALDFLDEIRDEWHQWREREFGEGNRPVGPRAKPVRMQVAPVGTPHFSVRRVMADPSGSRLVARRPDRRSVRVVNFGPGVAYLSPGGGTSFESQYVYAYETDVPPNLMKVPVSYEANTGGAYYPVDLPTQDEIWIYCLTRTYPNLVPNPEFETDTSNWSPYLGTFAVSSAQYYQGLKSGLYTATGAGTGDVSTGYTDQAVTSGKTYALSGYARMSTASSVSIIPHIKWYDSTVTLISAVSGSGVALNNSSWQKASMTATAPTNAAWARLSFISSGQAIGDAWHLDTVDFRASKEPNNAVVEATEFYGDSDVR